MPKSGGSASIFNNVGASSVISGVDCTRIGSTLEFYVTDPSKRWLDPVHFPTVTVAGNPVVPTKVDFAAGIITLPSYTSGTVLLSGYAFAYEWLGGGYGWSISPKTDKKDVTVFTSVLNTPAGWKEYISTLKDWTATISRHYWYARAWGLLNCIAANSDLIWSWKDRGTVGNAESVKYQAGSPLSVVRASHLTTVTFVDGVTTATAIKNLVAADPVLSLLWDVEYSGVQTGAGVIVTADAQTVVMTSGRDHSSDIARLGNKILVRFYMDVMTASQEVISAQGMLEEVPLKVALDSPIEADLNLQGTLPPKYHTV